MYVISRSKNGKIVLLGLWNHSNSSIPLLLGMGKRKLLFYRTKNRERKKYGLRVKIPLALLPPGDLFYSPAYHSLFIFGSKKSRCSTDTVIKCRWGSPDRLDHCYRASHPLTKYQFYSVQAPTQPHSILHLHYCC